MFALVTQMVSWYFSLLPVTVQSRIPMNDVGEVDDDDLMMQDNQGVWLGVPRGKHSCEMNDCSISRVGGAVIEPKTKPCIDCGKDLLFLVQIYAPVDDLNHRTLYVFGCNDPKCATANSFIVIRQINEVVANPVPPPKKPAAKKDKPKSSGLFLNMNFDSASCGNDSESLEDLLNMRDLKIGESKSKGKSSNTTKCNSTTTTRCAVLEIEYEPEALDAKNDNHIMDMLNRYYSEQESNNNESEEELDVGGTSSEYEADDSKPDNSNSSYMNIFQSRIEREPSQCIRYEYGGTPLWPCKPYHIQVPPCPCGKERNFEAQLVPSVLWQLEKECNIEISMDWLSVFIYSCPDNCSQSNEEFGIGIPSN